MSIDLGRWRIEKAEKTLLEGEKLLDLGFYNGAINRFYYSAFHAARALLATKGLDSVVPLMKTRDWGLKRGIPCPYEPTSPKFH